jgi:hypothetical protein
MRAQAATEEGSMSSTVSPAAWLQLAIARPLHAGVPAALGGRHRAPEAPGEAELLTSEQIAARAGRHAETEWRREAVDPAGDEADVFDWLGFAPVTD